MSDAQEREDLEALLKTAGWLRFSAFVKKNWGPEGFGYRIKAAITQASHDQTSLPEAIARVDAASNEINALMTWPKERVEQLLTLESQRKAEIEGTYSRRGSL